MDDDEVAGTTTPDKALTPSRRDFLRDASGLGAAVVAGSLFTRSSQVNAMNNDKPKLGFALVGLGNLSTYQIAPALQKTEHCELKAVVTGTPAKETVWAERYGIPASNIYNYENYDSIADNPDVDVIYIVLPNGMHAEYTIRGARAGKHILCEKPMANTAAECEAMIAACRDNGVKLAVGYRCHFEPHHQECMRLAREEVYGRVKLIEAGFGFRIGDPNQWRLDKALAGGGALMDVGIYALQASRYLTGEEPVEIFAIETKTDPVKFAQVDESIHWGATFPGGVVADCSTTYSVNGLNRFRVLADGGYFGMEPAYDYAGNRAFSNRDAIAFPEIDQFAAQMDDFALCIREGRESRVPGEEGLRDLRLIEAIYQSVRTGLKVRLDA